MSQSEAGTWWSYRRDGSVGIWRVEDWDRLFEEELSQAEQHFRTTAARSDIEAALVVFDEVDALGPEMQDHITEVWSGLAQAVDLEKVGYVADGITAMAVQSNVEAPDTNLDSFETLEAALSWAGD